MGKIEIFCEYLDEIVNQIIKKGIFDIHNISRFLSIYQKNKHITDPNRKLSFSLSGFIKSLLPEEIEGNCLI